MSFLDLYERDQRADAAIQPTEARDLPAGFGEAFSASWSHGWLFGQSIASYNARSAALSDYLADVERQTGKRLEIDNEGGGDPWAIASEEAKKLGLTPPTDDEIEQRAIAKSKAARTDYAGMAEREKTLGGSIGFYWLGGAAAAAADPINVLALPVAPAAGLGILATAARWALIAGTTQAAIEATGAPYREKVQPGYVDSGALIQNILEAGGGGAVLGGGFRGLGYLWTRMKTGAWPRSVRDAGNIVESEANVLDTNRFPGVEGEVAHRSALQDQIDRIIHGDPGEPAGLTESVLASYDKKLEPALSAISNVHEARNAVQMERAAQQAQVAPELPFAGSIAEGQEVAAVAKLGGHLEELARSVGAEIAPDEARALADKISRLPLNEATAVLDEFMLRPRTLPDTLPSVSAINKERRAAPKGAEQPMPPELHAQVSPEALEKLRAEPELDDTILRDLDRLRAEKGDLEIPVGETVGASGERVVQHRKIEDVLAEADERLSAAKEIEACAGPQQEAAE